MRQEKSCGCACGCAPTLIFACSGAADVGAVSDLAARKLAGQGAGKMFCLAGIGGQVPGILKSTETAAAVLAIDGCPLDCAKRTLEKAGFSGFHHLQINDLGLKKGESPVSDAAVAAVTAKGLELLHGELAPAQEGARASL